MTFFRIVVTGLMGSATVGLGVWSRDGDWRRGMWVGLVVGLSVGVVYWLIRRWLQKK